MRRTLFTLTLALIALLIPVIAFGADISFTIPGIDAGSAGDGSLSTTMQIVILLTVLTLLPAILLMMTSFTRFVIVFSLLRHALGLQQTPPNQVILGIALFMTFFVMSPVLNNAYTSAVKPYLASEVTQKEALARGIEPFREFMFQQTGEDELAFFIDMSGTKRPKDYDDVPTTVIIPAFITSELKRAFQIGFVIFIPFLIIDMVVASVLMSMGMMMLPPILISLPFKLMLFVLVDGWSVLVGSLVRSFH